MAQRWQVCWDACKCLVLLYCWPSCGRLRSLLPCATFLLVPFDWLLHWTMWSTYISFCSLLLFLVIPVVCWSITVSPNKITTRCCLVSVVRWVYYRNCFGTVLLVCHWNDLKVWPPNGLWITAKNKKLNNFGDRCVCVCVCACLGVVVWWHQRVPESNILYKSRSAGERGKRDERGYPGGVHTRDFKLL